MCHLLTHLLTDSTHSMKQSPSSEVNRPTSSQEFPVFFLTRSFTIFTSARHLPLSRVRSIQPIPPYHTSWRCILMLSHPHPGLSSFLFPSGLLFKIPYVPLFSHKCYISRESYSRFHLPLPNSIWRGVQIMKLPVMYPPPLPWYIDTLRPK
jgi:hypothetical protein